MTNRSFVQNHSRFLKVRVSVLKMLEVGLTIGMVPNMSFIFGMFKYAFKIAWSHALTTQSSRPGLWIIELLLPPSIIQLFIP